MVVFFVLLHSNQMYGCEREREREREMKVSTYLRQSDCTLAAYGCLHQQGDLKFYVCCYCYSCGDYVSNSNSNR